MTGILNFPGNASAEILSSIDSPGFERNQGGRRNRKHFDFISGRFAFRESHRGTMRIKGERARKVARANGSERLPNDSHPSRGKSPAAGPLDIKLFNIDRIVRFDAFPGDFSWILNSVSKSCQRICLSPICPSISELILCFVTYRVPFLAAFRVSRNSEQPYTYRDS